MDPGATSTLFGSIPLWMIWGLCGTRMLNGSWRGAKVCTSFVTADICVGILLLCALMLVIVWLGRGDITIHTSSRLGKMLNLNAHLAFSRRGGKFWIMDWTIALYERLHEDIHCVLYTAQYVTEIGWAVRDVCSRRVGCSICKRPVVARGAGAIEPLFHESDFSWSN
jgi:hypothetical protein